MHAPLMSSLPLRASIAVAAAMLAAAVVLVALIGWQANRALANRTLATLDAEALELRRIYDRGGVDLLTARIQDLSRASGPGLYALDNPDGRRLAGNLTAAKPAGNAVFTYAPVVGGPDRLAVARNIRIQATDGRALDLIVARDVEDQRLLARDIQWTALIGLGLIGLAALGLGLYARRRLLARVGSITATSKAIMAGDLTQRITRDASNDEIDQLAGNLNQMLARIDTLMQALRDVSDNIAHDLKTPLTRLRNTAEAALRDSPQGAAGQVINANDEAQIARDGLTRVLEESDALIQTFNAMLLIARLEPGMGDDDLQVLDIATVVDDLVDLYRPVAEEAMLELRVAMSGPHSVRANRQLLGQAFANLLDNAIKYSAGHAAARHIDVSILRVGERVEITIADQGPGIAIMDRERALTRFVRLEKSRSLPGTGLGLSLVAAVARLHHGEIRLEDNAPGLRAILSLPTLTTIAG
jgi:signal transduction histidine kinase